ncbi:unnamed protein product [Acanthosepion pharaonis]|uniref:Uncharacterized protein n=1 Tax=Acanthosepion pharaonis TaxID=158019 RepID=A0A812BPN4_ACAPH|nr:unnamed protein product [Sepia pharaonis]
MECLSSRQSSVKQIHKALPPASNQPSPDHCHLQASHKQWLWFVSRVEREKKEGCIPLSNLWKFLWAPDVSSTPPPLASPPLAEPKQQTSSSSLSHYINTPGKGRRGLFFFPDISITLTPAPTLQLIFLSPLQKSQKKIPGFLPNPAYSSLTSPQTLPFQVLGDGIKG